MNSLGIINTVGTPTDANGGSSIQDTRSVSSGDTEIITEPGILDCTGVFSNDIEYGDNVVIKVTVDGANEALVIGMVEEVDEDQNGWSHRLIVTMLGDHSTLELTDEEVELYGLEEGHELRLDLDIYQLTGSPEVGASFSQRHAAIFNRHRRKKRKRMSANHLSWREACIDPHVAARVTTTTNGIKTRRRFYPIDIRKEKKTAEK